MWDLTQTKFEEQPELRPTEKMKPYQPHGNMVKIFTSKDLKLFVEGPAGTGKTRANLEKTHLCMSKYPGARGMLLRKTKSSLAESILVTFEQKVVPDGHEVLDGIKRSYRQSYKYRNGSELVVAGLDDPQKVMSTEYDFIYLAEALDCTQDDFEMVVSRLRNGVMPYQQIIVDCNPSNPKHWLHNYFIKNTNGVHIPTSHRDNPALWDSEKNQYTEFGKKYVEDTLGSLTGARRDRLLKGLWVGAEGTIYGDVYDPEVHIVPRFMPKWEEGWEVWWSIDFGFSNPLVLGIWAVSPGRTHAYLVREIYHTGLLVEDAVRRAKEITKRLPRPEKIICDHDAEGRATVEKHLNRVTQPAFKEVGDGIQRVSEMLNPLQEGGPKLFFMEGSLDAVDPILERKHLPTCTVDEFDGYIWDQSLKFGVKDVPVKKDDHGMDMVRYIAMEMGFGKKKRFMLW